MTFDIKKFITENVSTEHKRIVEAQSNISAALPEVKSIYKDVLALRKRIMALTKYGIEPYLLSNVQTGHTRLRQAMDTLLLRVKGQLGSGD